MKITPTIPLPSVFFIKNDDEQDKAIANFLETRTSELTVTSLGEYAIRVFPDKRPDIIITNLELDDMDGIDLVGKIREKSPDQAFIIISSVTDSQVLLRLIDIGISKYMSKPLDFETFAETLIRVSKEVAQQKEEKDQRKILQEYKNAFDAATIISKTDKNGIITYANNEFCRISGYSRKELIGSSHNIVRHPDTPSATFRYMWETIQAKRIWKGRIKNKNKKGGFYIVDATIVPILDSNDEITEFLAIRQDKTRLLELEEKDRKEEEEQCKVDLMDQINKAKESFLLIFTHELKTPLNAIINFSDYLRKEISKTDLPNASKLTDLAVLIRENGYEMLNTVTTLLDLAKLKSHNISFNCAPFELATMIQSQIERSSSIAHQNNITITVEGSSSPIQITNDEARIRQIFSNLLSNAIKYGGTKILVSYGQNGNNFWMSVDDNGPGLTNTEVIFELFEQGQHNDLTRTAKGTGIGLYFVKMFCDRLGLIVKASRSSTLGGASFTILGPILFNPKGTV
jgi:PAS domain S-box-containing protein